MPFLTVESTMIGDVKIQSAELRSMAGIYELCFVVALSVNAPAQGSEERWYQMHGARVQAVSSGQSKPVGLAAPDVPALIVQRQNSFPTTVELKLPVSPGQLSALEDLRNGGDIDFQIFLLGTGAKQNRPRNEEIEHATLYLSIARSEWVKQLNSSKAANILLLEVAMPFVEPSAELGKMNAHIRHAIKHFNEGNYADCVAECRKLAELFPNASSSDVRKQLREDWTEMSKDDREHALLLMLRHYTHPPHHSVRKGGSADYSRADAKFVLSLVAAFSSLDSQRKIWAWSQTS